MTVYRLSSQVKRVMTQAEISQDTLVVMLSKSAVIRHPRGNRRYHDWVFDLDQTKVLRVTKIKHPVILEGDSAMYDACEECDGNGCIDCGWSGEVIRYL